MDANELLSRYAAGARDFRQAGLRGVYWVKIKADLSGVDLTGASLSNSNLSSRYLSNAHLNLMVKCTMISWDLQII